MNKIVENIVLIFERGYYAQKIGLKRIIIIILIPTLLLLPLFTILTLFSYTAFANEDITTYSRFLIFPKTIGLSKLSIIYVPQNYKWYR